MTGRRRGQRRSAVLDITPLRESPPFRRLITGQSLAMMASAILQVTTPIQIYQATGSAFLVGLVGFVGFIPLLASTLLGGVAADLYDRRKLLLLTSALCALISLTLTVQAAIDDRQIIGLFIASAAQSLVVATDTPTRRAAMPRLIPRRHYVAANSLLFGVNNVGTIGGPLLGGALLSTSGFATSYLVSALCYGGVFLSAYRLPPLPATPLEPAADTVPTSGGRAGVAASIDGMRFLRSQPILLTAMLADFFATTFAARRALYPVLAVGTFHGGVHATTLMYAAPAVGALLVVLTGGWLNAMRSLGLGIVLAITGWGATTIALGLTHTLWIALVLLAAGGAADAVNVVFRATTLQLIAPNEMQGRMSGLYSTFSNGGPRLGDLEAGGVSSLFSPAVSVTSGGIACCGVALVIAVLFPDFLRWRTPAQPSGPGQATFDPTASADGISAAG
jgi:MFS family permease